MDLTDAWPGISEIGLSLAAERARPADRSGDDARAALTDWCAAGGTSPAAHAEDFPYARILAHYQAIGRLKVNPWLITELANLHGRLGSPTGRAGLLAGWLVGATDQVTGDYESFLGADLLSAAIAADGRDENTVRDGLSTAFIADLAAYEARALAADPENRHRRTRTVAVANLLEPGSGQAGAGDIQGWQDLAARTGRRADAVLDGIPELYRRTVALSLMPITPLHDEYMFLRSVQIFELLYWRLAGHIADAAAALDRGDRERATAGLASAGTRMAATPPLYRVLTTIDKAAFAVIRDNTDGRSAIQSRPYRMVEMLCAPRNPPPHVVDKIPKIELSGPSLQEVHERAVARHGEAALRPVTEAMARFDKAWRSAKLTHWGITMKVIGQVRGTGGTAGAHYLRDAADIRLFPALEDGPR